MSGHTEGPWTVTGAGFENVNPGECAYYISVPEGMPISMANARLIAAAPELLAALEQVARPYGMLDLAVSEHANGPRGNDMLEAARLVRAAIAKATGK